MPGSRSSRSCSRSSRGGPRDDRPRHQLHRPGRLPRHRARGRGRRRARARRARRDRLRLGRGRRRRGLQVPRHPRHLRARHLHRAPGGRARRRQRALPRRARDRPGARGGGHPAFAAPQFTGEERHVRRLGKIRPSRTSSRRCRWPTPASSRGTTSRSPSTAWSATCTRSRSSARTARSTGTAARRSTRRACSARSSTPDEGGFYSLRPAGDDVDLQAALLPGHERPDHALLHRGGVGEVQDFMPIEDEPACTATG